MVEPMFYAVFFDVDKPQTVENSINKRIQQKEFNNLVDEAVPDKEVLLAIDNVQHWYIITSRKTFQIWNTVDNHFFIVLEIKKKA